MPPFPKGPAKGLQRACEGFAKGLRRVCKGPAKGLSLLHLIASAEALILGVAGAADGQMSARDYGCDMIG